MNLSSLSIKNLRGIDHLKIKMYDFNSFIGKNNTGKSTIIRAIDLFLSLVKPTLEEWRRGHEEESIEIEGEFDRIEDWEKHKPGVSGLVNYEDKIKLLYRATQEGGKVDVKFFYWTRDVVIPGWSETWSDLSEEIKSIARNMEITNQAKWKTKANQNDVRRAFIEQFGDQIEYGEEKWSDESISIPAGLKQAIPQIALIPAMRSAEDEAKTTATSSFGILLKKLIVPAIEQSAEFQSVVMAVDQLSIKLRNMFSLICLSVT